MSSSFRPSDDEQTLSNRSDLHKKGLYEGQTCALEIPNHQYLRTDDVIGKYPSFKGAKQCQRVHPN